MSSRNDTLFPFFLPGSEGIYRHLPEIHGSSCKYQVLELKAMEHELECKATLLSVKEMNLLLSAF
ncbi:hypothetical protein GIB67_006905 [Kingdonia uniflora]|uniref:Uncharacterized protein n=1 Tax=Kingdonia uniflora TaxID=39325 RepID=A0A7J7L089_9MAGN|nr:hypothetical protein GIB67_006905 [Kingdonia uniflora]